jgi:hypothetical protein
MKYKCMFSVSSKCYADRGKILLGKRSIVIQY